MAETTPDIAALRTAEIMTAAQGSNVIDRTLEVISIVDAVSAPLGIHPVVVGGTAKIVSRVDILIDRLNEFQATGHEVPAQQALALLAGLQADETENLEERASIHGITAILKAVCKLADAVKAGRTPPDSGELREIAKAALRSDYPSSSQ